MAGDIFSLLFKKNEIRFLKLKCIHLEKPQNFSSKWSLNYIPVFHLEIEGNQTSGTQQERQSPRDPKETSQLLKCAAFKH